VAGLWVGSLALNDGGRGAGSRPLIRGVSAVCGSLDYRSISIPFRSPGAVLGLWSRTRGRR